MNTKVLVIKADKHNKKEINHQKSNQIYKNVSVSVEERALTQLNPDEIRVEMICVGICGTDIHLTTKNSDDSGKIHCTAPFSIPEEGRIIGHEGVGRILEVGSNIKHLFEGMYVTFESIIVCNVCDICRRGKYNQCRDAVLLGLEKDGLLGTVVDVPAKLAHNITEYIKTEKDLISLACIEPAGVAYVACENAKIKGGDVVVVFGAGPIGLLSAILSKKVFGASEVHIVEPVEYRRNFSKQWADKVYSCEEFYNNCPKNIDAIIEASGVLDNIKNTFEKINANGHVVILARSGHSLELKSVDYMITNEINIKGSRGHLGGAYNNILNLYKMNRIDLSEIITLVVDGLDELKILLENNEILLKENCKVIVKL